MKEIFRGKDIDCNKQQISNELANLNHIIKKGKLNRDRISDFAYQLIINLTETKDADILDLASKASESFIDMINKNINKFNEEELPTVFAALQLFAVEAGQYDYEIMENPDSEINKLTGKYNTSSSNRDLVQEAYLESRNQLKVAYSIREKAIQAIICLFKRNEFSELNRDGVLEWELFPLITGINSDKRYRPFRVVEASKIGDKIYRFALQARDERLKKLLISIYSKKEIRFGTSGFRAFINKDFTQRRSDIISLAIARDLKNFQQKDGKPIIIVYDTRIFAREFALESARVFLAQGFPVKLSLEATPTGALVYWLREIENGQAAGGENMTPSHNPLSTQGQRWNLSNGDVAPTSVTDRIEREANLINLCAERIEKADLKIAENSGKFSYFNARYAYTSWVASFLKDQKLNLIDDNGNISKAVPLVDYLRDFYTNPANRFIHNAMNGAGRGYVSEIFEKIGIPLEFVYPLDSNNDEFLGLRYYANPEEQWLVPTLSKLKLSKALFECASDTDGDRCGGVLDQDKFINLNKLMAMLMDFVIRGLGWKGHVAIRSGTTSTALDDVVSELKSEGYDIETPECDQVNSLVQHPFYDVLFIKDANDQSIIDMQKFPSIVTEVGFKYISAAMKKYGHPAAVAGEESGGFTIKYNPDKDGIVGVCLIASMIAWHKMIPSTIWEEHQKKYGEKFDKRLDVWVSNIPKEQLINSWLDNPPHEIAGQEVLWVGGTRYDKVECILKDQRSKPDISRLLVRASGTEDIVRIYMESGREDSLQILEKYVLGRINHLVLDDIDSSQNYYELAEKVASNGLSFFDEQNRVEYFEHVRAKMDKLARCMAIEPLEIYRSLLKLLTVDMDRDINIRHAGWDVDIGVEYYRYIFI